MTKKVLYTNFEGIDDTLAKMLEDKNLKKAITRSNLFKFWQKVVGEKFKDNSKPFSMTANGGMIVACKNPAVAQELMFRKTKILTELTPYLKSLKMKVTDLRFDVKRWVDEEE